MNKNKKYISIAIVGLILINGLSNQFFKRFDLTKDKRFTLSQVSENVIDKIDKNFLINVYLEGDFPAEFQRLQIETRQFLEELEAKNSKVKFRFINPDGKREQLVKSGMMPSQLTIEEDGKLSEAIIFPWAEIVYGRKIRLVSLLPTTMAKSQEEQLQNAISNLEFSFLDVIKTMLTDKTKKIAILSGNGQLEDKYLYSFLAELKNKYLLAKFTLDSVAKSPLKTLKQLKEFDLAVIAKPTEHFTEAEKLTLDQFITNGGKSIWMLDTNIADVDSLYNQGQMLAYPRDLRVTDLLFNYGIRVNSHLVKDLNSSKIPLVTGNVGNQSQFKSLNWFFHPLAKLNPFHPITKNIMPVRMRFATQIDTLKSNPMDKNKIKKTPLLVSSVLTKKVGTPNIIKLSSISEKPTQKEYNNGNQLFGVLLEGRFKSAYKDRTLFYDIPDFKSESVDNKMVVISDGDVVKNQIVKGKPFDLSVDKWTRQRFGNKDFLLKTVDYLLDDSGLIQLRNKMVALRTLDKQKVYANKTFWQFVNIVLPLFLLGIFGFAFMYYRKRKYEK